MFVCRGLQTNLCFPPRSLWPEDLSGVDVVFILWEEISRRSSTSLSSVLDGVIISAIFVVEKSDNLSVLSHEFLFLDVKLCTDDCISPSFHWTTLQPSLLIARFLSYPCSHHLIIRILIRTSTLLFVCSPSFLSGCSWSLRRMSQPCIPGCRYRGYTELQVFGLAGVDRPLHE